MEVVRQTDMDDFEGIVNLAEQLGSFRLYFLRIGRASAHSFSAYLLLWLQPHFSFSFISMAAAVFFLSLPKRTLPVAEIILLIIAAPIFVPNGLLQTLVKALS